MSTSGVSAAFRAVAGAVTLIIVGGVLAAAADGAPRPGVLGFSAPTLFPRFNPRVHEYVVRCHDDPVTVDAHARGRWRIAIGRTRLVSGKVSSTVELAANRLFVVTAKRDGSTRRHRYRVRCLPTDFPDYSFTRYGQVHPRYFTLALGYYGKRTPYAVIFDHHGVPVWWEQDHARDPRVLPDGRMLWAAGVFGPTHWEIHSLDGNLLRRLNTVGSKADDHDLEPLGRGRYLAGTYVQRQHVDTSAYGGSPDATVTDAELQEVAPGRELEWSWNTADHISLAETGRNWPFVSQSRGLYPNDLVHWNSIDADRGAVVASFRHLDAVYKIRRASGNIAWKLGGTHTRKSLEVRHDPHPYVFGNQHDARVLPDGSVTVFDNRTNLADSQPRAARYRIDPRRGTATMIEQIKDPAVTASYWGGSARRLPGGDWLIDWGANVTGTIGGYTSSGEPTFRLTTVGEPSYRAEPVPRGVLSPRLLRRAMRAMYSSRSN
jgi:hypothetical protein